MLHDVQVVDLHTIEAGDYLLRVRDTAGARVFDRPFGMEFDAPLRGRTHESSATPDRDRLWAGDGDDILVGGSDIDLLVGASGNDTFVGEEIEATDIGVLDQPLVAAAPLISGSRRDPYPWTQS